MRRPARWIAAALSLTAAGLASPAAAYDRAAWAALLLRHTRAVDDTAGTRVDYTALRASPEWRALVESFAVDDPDALPGDAARLAFWIDAYNVFAIDMVVRERPQQSIRDVGFLPGAVWRRDAGVVAGRSLSLNEIEHEILRPMGEPRIHAAIVCASVSCPSLRREPYHAKKLDAQLDDAVRRWLASPDKGARLDRDRKTLHLSRIFKWFDEDFEPAGGVIDFVLPYLAAPDRDWIAEQREEIELDYLDYDWSLNAL